MTKLSTITIITLVLLSTPTFAQYPDGNGTEADPWQIADANDLLYLASHPNDYNSHFILTADINLAGCDFNTAVIAPDTNNSSGFQGTEFTGTFDGDSHAIRNLTIDTNSANNYYLGLFGRTGSTSEIKNLSIEDVNMNGGYSSKYYGALAGFNLGTIINCYTTGDVNGGLKSSEIGGLVGINECGNISNCYADFVITAGSYLGGLVGKNSHIINNCYSSGTVTGGGSLGGLVGENDSGTIKNCHARSDVNGRGDIGGLVGLNIEGEISNCYSISYVAGGIYSNYLGGLVGRSEEGKISNSYSIGSVIGGDNSEGIGGLVGYNGSNTISNCYATGAVTGEWDLGGLVGCNETGTIINCYSIGSVTGNIFLGGLMGFNSGTVSNCFWDKETSDTNDGVGNMDPDPNGAMGRTTAQMQTQSTFTGYGWDFVGETANGTEDIWHMPYKINGYPMLYWQRDIPGDIIASYGVNFADFATMANAWRSTPSDDNWNSLCDLYPNNAIDWLDLQILFENWLSFRYFFPGDIAGSYGVNFFDFAVLANTWKSTPSDNKWNVLCDLYPDYVINWHDLKILSENWLNGL